MSSSKEITSITASMNVKLQPDTLKAYGYVGPELAFSHLKSAKILSDLLVAHEKEMTERKEPRGYNHSFDIARAYATGAIFSAFASIEANAAEVIASPAIKIDKDIMVGIEKLSALEKCQAILALFEKSKFDEGKPIYQHADTLKKLRNELIHFKPYTSKIKSLKTDKSTIYKKIEDKIRGKFETSPLAPENSQLFPIGCMSAGCASWAVKTALNFNYELMEKMQLGNPFDGFKRTYL